MSSFQNKFFLSTDGDYDTTGRSLAGMASIDNLEQSVFELEASLTNTDAYISASGTEVSREEPHPMIQGTISDAITYSVESHFHAAVDGFHEQWAIPIAIGLGMSILAASDTESTTDDRGSTTPPGSPSAVHEPFAAANSGTLAPQVRAILADLVSHVVDLEAAVTDEGFPQPDETAHVDAEYNEEDWERERPDVRGLRRASRRTEDLEQLLTALDGEEPSTVFPMSRPTDFAEIESLSITDQTRIHREWHIELQDIIDDYEDRYGRPYVDQVRVQVSETRLNEEADLPAEQPDDDDIEVPHPQPAIFPDELFNMLETRPVALSDIPTDERCSICWAPYNDEHVPVMLYGNLQPHAIGRDCLRLWIGGLMTQPNNGKFDASTAFNCTQCTRCLIAPEMRIVVDFIRATRQANPSE